MKVRNFRKFLFFTITNFLYEIYNICSSKAYSLLGFHFINTFELILLEKSDMCNKICINACI